MKAPSRWTPTTQIAAVLVVVAAASVAAYCAGWLQAWMPNVAVGALVTAATITVIDRAVRREAQQLLQPRTDAVLRNMAIDFHLLVAGIAFDYAGAPGDRFVPLPQDALGIIDLWLSTRGKRPLSYVAPTYQTVQSG